MSVKKKRISVALDVDAWTKLKEFKDENELISLSSAIRRLFIIMDGNKAKGN